jgi:hypothetical protein
VNLVPRHPARRKFDAFGHSTASVRTAGPSHKNGLAERLDSENSHCRPRAPFEKNQHSNNPSGRKGKELCRECTRVKKQVISWVTRPGLMSQVLFHQ